MFKITYLVKDDDLLDAIRMVTPIAISLNVTSAPNGEATLVPPSVLLRRKSRSRGAQALGRLMHALSQRNLTTFKASMFREVVKQAGLNPVSYGHYLKELSRVGCLSRLGKGSNMTWQVIGQTP